ISGYFDASHGDLSGLFSQLRAPIVERFDVEDELDRNLHSALSGLVNEEINSHAMSAALVEQVLLTVLRRSLRSAELWLHRFSVLSDPQIVRAFSAMVSRPGAKHSVASLAKAAGLGRSAFMERFSAAIGDSPIGVLRELRMRRAELLLETDELT